MRVWVEGWQLEDGAELFSVGSEVEWGLVPLQGNDKVWLSRPLGAEAVESITHFETHHRPAALQPQPVMTRGRVTSITAVHYELAQVDEHVLGEVPDSAVFEAREHAGHWEAEDWNYFMGGYIVELEPLD